MTDPDSSRVAARAGRPKAEDNDLDVDIVEDGGDWSAFAPVDEAIHAAAREVAAEIQLAIGRASASIALGDDARVRELNRAYRGRDKSTNVLSFPAATSPSADDRTYLGDIILASETVLAEAGEQGLPPRHHLQHLVVHGLLHLLGFDHILESDAEEMEGLETTILARLGVPDPYADGNGLDG